MFKLIKKIPLEYDGICYYKENYLLLKNNIIDLYDNDFNKIKEIKLDNKFNYITCNNEYIFLANKKEIYKYDFDNLIKLDINLDIININYIDNLIIITNDKVYSYSDKLNEYLNIKCTNMFNINDKKYFIKENELYEKNKIQCFDFRIKDCCYNNCLILLSDYIYIYNIDCYDKISKLLKCLCKNESIPSSMACIEKALANILNEEANKIKKAICLSNNIYDLIKINESVNQTIKNIILLEQVLCTKLDIYNSKK